MIFLTLVGFILVALVAFQLIKKVGNDLPILDIMYLIAGLQWIVGPYIDYSTIVSDQKYYMYVPEHQYMSVVVPLYFAFVIPYYFITYFKPTPLNLNVESYNNHAVAFITIGFLSTSLGKFLPQSLAFIFYLLSNLIYVGASIILIQKSRKYNFLAYLSILWLLYTSIKTGFFHNLILWSVFLFFIWSIKNKTKRIYTIAIIIAAFFSAAVIQTIKVNFRKQLPDAVDPIGLFSEMVMNTAFNNSIVSNEKDANELNVRLNQGWIISAIFKNVPKHEPFANGGTVKEAITSSLLPRFFSENKTNASGRENFRKFTGLSIRDDTSMGISILGESYANYGRNGGFIFMFIWGWLLTIFWKYLIRFQNSTTLLLFFIPLIFLQVVKAETELVIVLNHLVKASIVSFGIIWLFKNILPTNDEGQ